MPDPDLPDPGAQPDPAAPLPTYPPPAPYGQPPYGQPPYGAPQYGAASGYLPPQQYGVGPALPGAVKAVSILMYVGAGFAVLGAIGLLFVTAAVGRSSTVGHTVGAFTAVLGVVLFAIAAAYIVLATFLRRGSRVARMITVVLTGLSMLANLSHVHGASVISLVIGALIIYLLMFNADAKRFFGDRVG